jgi:hypothetical protein
MIFNEGEDRRGVFRGHDNDLGVGVVAPLADLIHPAFAIGRM